MTRDIPADMIEDLSLPNTGNVWMWLCEIVVPTYDTIRYAKNNQDVVYADNTFRKFNFDVGKQVLSGDGSIPRIVLRISQDISKVMETIINATEGGLGSTVKLIKVNSDFLDTSIPALEVDYDLLLAESDAEWVILTLGIPNPLTQRIPLRTQSSSMCPYATPSLFKGPRCQYAGADTSCTGTIIDCRDNKDNAENWGGDLGLDPNVSR